MASSSDMKRLTENDEAFKTVRLMLRPKCDIKSTVRALKGNTSVTKVDCHVYKQFTANKMKSIMLLFEGIGKLESLESLELLTKGVGAQPVPLEAITACLTEAVGMEVVFFNHIKLEGTLEEIGDFAHALRSHESLREFKLDTESADDLTEAIEALALCQSLEKVDITTTGMSSSRGVLGGALKVVCTSRTIKEMNLNVMALRFEKFSELTKVLGANQVMETLSIQDEELDNTNAEAVGTLIMTNKCLKRFYVKLDKVHSDKLGEEIQKGLEVNRTLEIFHLIVDGRLTDFAVIRTASVSFKKAFGNEYEIDVDMGLTMVLKCIRRQSEPS